MDITLLVNVTARAWSLDILARIAEGTPCRQAPLIAATGTDPVLLALPVAMAASWGFMLPSGTGPNALAWATGNIALPRMLKAGLALDLLGVPLLIGIIWAIAALA